LELLGHDVIRLNHVGDWGTQFGMLIHYLKETQGEEGIQRLLENFHEDDPTQTTQEQPEHIHSLLSLYRQARQRFTSDPEFEKQSKLEVYKLQNHDHVNLKLWKYMCHLSRREFRSIYDLLKVDSRLLERGESFYNSSLSEVVRDLIEKKIASTHDGAVLIFESNLSELKAARRQGQQPEGYGQQQQEHGAEDGLKKKTSQQKKSKDKTDSTSSSSHSALMIQKSDGAYLYGTTDIAAVYHR
jgi:arginyl-tRNA synthetase